MLKALQGAFVETKPHLKFYTKDKDLMKPKTSNSSRISFFI
jgi:hypothetical protein